MPATSTAQRRLMAIGEHHPSQLYAKNRGILRMSHSQLHDFAATREKGLPHYAPPKKKKRLSDVVTAMRMRHAFGPRRPAMPMARHRVPGPSSYGAGVD